MMKHQCTFAAIAAFALVVNCGAADVNYIWANTSSDMNSASSYFLSDGTTVSTAVQARTRNHGSITSFSFPSVHRPLTGAFAPRTVHDRARFSRSFPRIDAEPRAKFAIFARALLCELGVLCVRCRAGEFGLMA